jgi:hypothetical protein
MNILEPSFVAWSKGPGQTEMDRCTNADSMVRKAIASYSALSKLSTSIFAQGSYRARTNVRQDSDVDICVRYNDSFFPEVPEGKTWADFGIQNSPLTFSDFKGLVASALQNYFGVLGVTRGNKAFDVHANTYRIDADVIPAFVHRRYTGKLNNDLSHNFLEGIAFCTDKREIIINWPQQTYDNGVLRNDITGREYKRVIRILKRLRYMMQDDKIPESMGISSFLIECLVWNAPLDVFNHDSYTEILWHLIASIWNDTKDEINCNNWLEVNNLKYLFHPGQPWTRKQVNDFLLSAWSYIGYP